MFVVAGTAAAAYAWDQSRSEFIAKGVKVGPVDVGGVNTDEARKLLKDELVKPLKGPVEVSFGKKQYQLDPSKVGLKIDLDGMVDAAVSASREGWLGSRLWREVSGSSLNREVPVKLSYNKEKLTRWTVWLKSELDVPARDATVNYSTASLSVAPSRDGVTINRSKLQHKLERSLTSVNRNKDVEVSARKVKPEVTTTEVRSKYPVVITIDRTSKQLRFWRNLELAKTYTIAVGQAGYETAAGLYNITDKSDAPVWCPPDSDWVPDDLKGKCVQPGPDNPLKARWMGFFAGAGIHGTDDIGSLGTAASHGCIRMSVPDVVELYPKVPIGTPVYIA